MNSQIAITLLKNLEQSLDDYCELNDEGKTAFSMAITALELFGNSEQLPSVQPRKGKITYTEFCEELWGQSAVCGLCGCSWQIAEDGNDNFCPNCGADMRERNSDMRCDSDGNK